MRLIPAEAVEFRQGQVYVAGTNFEFMRLDRFENGVWTDDDGGEITEANLIGFGWYLIDPSDDPAPVAPEPKRDEFWEKCFLAALTGLCAGDDHELASSIALAARNVADACVAERKYSEGTM